MGSRLPSPPRYAGLANFAWAQVHRSVLIPKAHLVVENLALRQQLAVLKRSAKRPKLRPRDRVFWVWLSRFWSNWRCALAIVQPDTVVRWHRQGFTMETLRPLSIRPAGLIEFARWYRELRRVDSLPPVRSTQPGAGSFRDRHDR